jgi:hypothetical protein
MQDVCIPAHVRDAQRASGPAFTGNFQKPHYFVVPAKAGIQSFVLSETWNGLVPGFYQCSDWGLVGNQAT